MTDFPAIIRLLAEAQVNFIIVGGAAATAHGSARLPEDLDIVYRRTRDNVAHLVRALAPYQPYLRDAPAGLPFSWDERTIWRGLNFTLTTSLGAVCLRFQAKTIRKPAVAWPLPWPGGRGLLPTHVCSRQSHDCRPWGLPRSQPHPPSVALIHR